jgi:hypothetical protein
MSASTASGKVNFATFFAMWAEDRGWTVPDIHWMAVHWLEHRADLAVLRCFRGFGKSTILAIYNAWRYYVDPSYRILHQGDQDKTAYKTSRDTKAVLQRHPLTRDTFSTGIRGEASFWWVPGANDERNPSMQAAGITSNITSSRCDEAQNDDVEVPRNIQNPEAREKMRYRLGEQTHCMVPGARQLFIGTPHTHDSLYDEKERAGADCLTIRMFEKSHRIEQATGTRYVVPFKPEWVFVGVGESAQLLSEGTDFTLKGNEVIFERAPSALLDFYAGHAWPERFVRADMLKRRRGCKTINEWDSQYQLHSRPLHQVRLDPAHLKRYAVEPVLKQANGELAMWLGKARIVGASCRWDPASGKLKSDVSALAVILQDEQGRRYWHRALQLVGEVAKFDDSGEKIIGGQVLQIVEVVKELALGRVTVETNGIGAFAPAVLKAAFKQAKLQCGVSEDPAVENKNRRILEAMEPPLTSGTLWAHTSVYDAVSGQMRDWNPAVKEQPDDHLDAAAGAITEAPERISRIGWNAPQGQRQDWRPTAGTFEVEVEM